MQKTSCIAEISTKVVGGATFLCSPFICTSRLSANTSSSSSTAPCPWVSTTHCTTKMPLGSSGTATVGVVGVCIQHTTHKMINGIFTFTTSKTCQSVLHSWTGIHWCIQVILLFLEICDNGKEGRRRRKGEREGGWHPKFSRHGCASVFCMFAQYVAPFPYDDYQSIFHVVFLTNLFHSQHQTALVLPPVPYVRHAAYMSKQVHHFNNHF